MVLCITYRCLNLIFSGRPSQPNAHGSQMRFIVFAGLLCGAAGGSRTDEEDIPSVRIQPKSLQFAEGKTFSLTCNVDAKPTPELIWFFEGKRLYPDLKYNITKSRLSLHMYPVQT